MSSELDGQTNQPSLSAQQSPLRKRRRLNSPSSQSRRRGLQSKYNDAYRELFNQDVTDAAARFEFNQDWQHHAKQIGVSTWSSHEQAIFFSALQRLGRADTPGIAKAIRTKSIPEVQDYLLLLQQSVAKHGGAKAHLRDIPAAVEVGRKCVEQLDLAGEALAQYQELFEAGQEQDKFGGLWLITPAIANDIEHAVALRESLEMTPLLNSQGSPHRRGQMVVGSCIPCKRSKRKCDRKIPCSTCIRGKITNCVYPEKAIKQDPSNSPPGSPTVVDGVASSKLLDAIPEACLLKPDILLMLSKNLFMNRCPTLASPWLHWSQCTSEFANEPAIYRSAFNDLHGLVISITRRLIQTAIMQATSRLRSQRRNMKKSLAPLVKRRDVFAAVDVVGMKRNGKERWRGVAKRCALRVFEGRRDCVQNGKHRTELSWDQVEKRLTSLGISVNSSVGNLETSATKNPLLGRRASERETPLPLENLTLADPDEESVYLDASSDTESETGIHQPPLPHESLPENQSERSSSAALEITIEESEARPQTLEQLDQQASRQAEHTLWQMLDLEPLVNGKRKGIIADDEEGSSANDKIVTESDDWRAWTEYKAPWEEFRTHIPPQLFLVDHKKRDEDLIAYPMISLGSASRDSNISSGGSSKRANPSTELHVQGTRAYAALQERSPHSEFSDILFDSMGSNNDDAKPDMPSASFRDDRQVMRINELEDEKIEEGKEESELEEDEMDLDS